jgi:hypothetical protein
MKTMLYTATSMAFLAAAHLSPAMAEGPKASGGDTWRGMSVPSGTAAPTSAAPAAHYVWREGYEHGGRWHGHWVLVP